MKKRSGVVVGIDYYASFLAELMNEHSTTWRFRAFRNNRIDTIRAILAIRHADVLVTFGGPAPDAALTEAARQANVPVIVVWAGSDVIKAQNDPLDFELVKQEQFINLSDGPWLVDELAQLGVSAEYLPLTAVRDGGPVRPFPRVFRVLTNLPDPRREFYGAQTVYEVARAMPDVPFIAVGAGGIDLAAPSNVQFTGRVNDMQDRIDSATVVLRVPKHDGKSMLVLEALARARHVVWNYEFPTITSAKTTDEIVDALRRLRKLHAVGALELNHDGRAFALQNFSRADIAARFEARLQGAVQTHDAIHPRPMRSVAISGLSLFCAEVASYTKALIPAWEPRLLRANSRLEVLTSIVRLATCDVWYTIGSPITDRWLHLASRLLRKPQVVHWVGSDIGKLRKDPRVLQAAKSPLTLHLAEVEWTAEELRSFGLHPRIAPLPPRHCAAGSTPLPQRFTVLLYVPRTRAEFYGVREFERLMEALRGEDIHYLVVGGGPIDAPPGIEVENLGWQHSLEAVYEQVTVLIRLTKRDGLSLMVLEALTYGRHVLWTQDFPFTRHVRGYDDMEREIRDLLAAHKLGQLKPQSQAAQTLKERYSPKTCMQAIARAWADAAEPGIKPELAVEPS